MENLLQSIVKTNTETQKKLDDQTVVLNKILAIESKRADVEKKQLNEDKRQERKDKRKGSERSLLSGLKKEAKKDKKGGILGALLGGGGLGSIVKLLVASKVLIAGLATVVGGAIFAYIKSEKFRKVVNTITSTLWDFTVKNVLKPTWAWIKEKGPEAYKWLETNILKPTIDYLQNNVGKILGGLGNAINNKVNRFAGGSDASSNRTFNTSSAQTRLGDVTGKLNNSGIPESERKDLEEQKRILELLTQRTIQSRTRENQIEDYIKNAERKEELLKNPTFLNNNPVSQAIFRDSISRSKIEVDKLKKELTEHQKETQRIAKHHGFLEDLTDLSGYEKKQTGGHINVPGQGSGDKVPMMLPGGSFVMNRNASMMLQQGGMVPTLLEPGEKVFGPGSWGPMEQMMNSTFGRFQEGGQVGDTDIWNSFLKNTTPKPDPKAGTQPKGAEKETFKPGTQTKGPVAPGGHLDFIGDGSGFTGELRFIDGKGKTVGSYGGISGSSHGAGSTQEQRKTISGQFLPLPDGSYPIESPMGSGSAAVGSFAAWINNTSGAIGNRSQLFLHNDIGSNGTAGCIGTELGGMRGPNTKTNEFTDLYNKVAPKKVNVGLGRSDGKAFAPGSGGGGGGGGDNSMTDMVQSALGGFAGFAGEIAKAFMSVFDPTGTLGGISELFKGSGGKDDVMSGVTESSEQLTGDMSAKAKEMVEYIKQKGYSTAQARGLVANAIRESSLNAKVMSGDDGGYGGLFQWKGVRQTAQVQDLVKSGNWKGQIDYALQEDAGPRYLSETSGMNAHEAADWWDRKWERSADAAHSSMRHGQILQGFQTGGNVSNLRGASNASNVSMVSKSQEMFAQKIAEAVTPVVIPMPSGGGGGSVISQSGGNTPVPDLPSADSSIMAMEYKYRITMGASV